MLMMMATRTEMTPPLPPAADADGLGERRAVPSGAEGAVAGMMAVAPLADPTPAAVAHPAPSVLPEPPRPPGSVAAAVISEAAASHPSLPATPADAAARTGPATGAASPPPPRSRPGDEATHRERLRRRRDRRGGRRPAGPRDASWQLPQRRLEQLIRGEAVTFAEQLQLVHVPLTETADLLNVPARTLRHWRHQAQRAGAAVPLLGRPPVRCSAEQGTAVLGFLHGHGPWVGLPTLRAEFADVPRAELHDLLAVYRHLWSVQHPRVLQELHWLQVGAVWAMDFTDVKQRIDGCSRYVFAVRDLASGMQLAWLPVADLTTAPVRAELQVLFTIYGAPLVLKSDNGSAFRAEVVKALFRRWQVWPLYSPPGQPGYNGAIEASIGSLKKRTQFLTERAGHPDDWTSVDLEQARAHANGTSRPQGPQGPTPQQAWEWRRPLTRGERQAFAARVIDLEEQARCQAGIARDEQLNHYEQATLHRRVLQEALVGSGILSITRRRIAQRFFGQKVANIW